MFEQRLYRLRKERGISQEELADIVGVSRQAVQKWESGASQPNMDNLVAISTYFGVTLDYLLKGTQPPPAGDPPQTQTVYVPMGWHYEYKSRRTLLGLPLVHVNLGRYGIRWARGIIAVGNVATGGLAIGGLSAGRAGGGRSRRGARRSGRHCRRRPGRRRRGFRLAGGGRRREGDLRPGRRGAGDQHRRRRGCLGPYRHRGRGGRCGDLLHPRRR